MISSSASPICWDSLLSIIYFGPIPSSASSILARYPPQHHLFWPDTLLSIIYVLMATHDLLLSITYFQGNLLSASPIFQGNLLLSITYFPGEPPPQHHLFSRGTSSQHHLFSRGTSSSASPIFQGNLLLSITYFPGEPPPQHHLFSRGTSSSASPMSWFECVATLCSCSVSMVVRRFARFISVTNSTVGSKVYLISTRRFRGPRRISFVIASSIFHRGAHQVLSPHYEDYYNFGRIPGYRYPGEWYSTESCRVRACSLARNYVLNVCGASGRDDIDIACTSHNQIADT